MKKPALYSSTVRSPWRSPSPRPAAAATGVAATAPSPDPSSNSRSRAFMRRHQRVLLVVAGMLFALLPVLIYQAIQDPPQEIAQEDIDAAVIHTLETKSLQSRAARAAESVRQSVVRVHGYIDDPMGPPDPRRKTLPTSRPASARAWSSSTRASS